MMSPFGFLRFSCSLLVDCFVKTKRRKRRDGGRYSGSDSEGEEEDFGFAKTSTVASAAKSAIAKVKIRVCPPRPVAKPCLISFLTFFTRSKRHAQPMLTPAVTAVVNDEENGVTDNWQKDLDVRNRRAVCNGVKINKFDGLCKVFAKRSSLETENERASEGSLSSDECSYYPSDDEAIDMESCDDLDMCSDFSPRTSCEFPTNNQGLNPTFYGSEFSDEEETCPLPNTMAMRRMNSVVEGDAQLKENAHAKGRQQLLMNPAYGSKSVEIQGDSTEDTEEMEMQAETKLKSLKSAVKGGCRALPTSTALVGFEYIGHTSLNPTYGDCSLAREDEDETATPLSETRQGVPPSPFFSASYTNNDEAEKNPFHLEKTEQNETCGSPNSMPMLSFRGLADGGSSSQNMGTLTWRNIAYSSSEASDDGEVHSEAERAVTDLQIKWKETLRADSIDVSSPSAASPRSHESSLFADPSSFLQDVRLRSHRIQEESSPVKSRPLDEVKGITERHVTPVHSIPIDSFEDIDIKCPSVPVDHERHRDLPSESSKHSRPTAAADKGPLTFLTSGLKNTRWALRSLTLVLDRIDVFSTSNKQK